MGRVICDDYEADTRTRSAEKMHRAIDNSRRSFQPALVDGAMHPWLRTVPATVETSSDHLTDSIDSALNPVKEAYGDDTLEPDDEDDKYDDIQKDELNKGGDSLTVGLDDLMTSLPSGHRAGAPAIVYNVDIDIDADIENSDGSEDNEQEDDFEAEAEEE